MEFYKILKAYHSKFKVIKEQHYPGHGLHSMPTNNSKAVEKENVMHFTELFYLDAMSI